MVRADTHCDSAADQLVVDAKPDGDVVDWVWMENERQVV